MVMDGPVSLAHWVNHPQDPMEPGPGSLDVCATQCHAKCCRSPGHLLATPEEVHRLKAIAKARKIKVVFETARGRTGVFGMDFKRNGGQCPFLAEDWSCSVYADRPGSCQRFPGRPTEGCLVWPGSDHEVRVEANPTLAELAALAQEPPEDILQALRETLLGWDGAVPRE